MTLPTPTSIPRVSGPDARSLVAEHLARGHPVVFEGLLSGWSALGKWTPRYFASSIGAHPVKIYEFTRRDAVTVSMREWVDWLEGNRDAGPLSGRGDALYLAWDASVMRKNPALRADFDFESLFPSGPGVVHTGFWMGGPGAHTPLHQDLDAPNLHAVVAGQKRFLLFAPDEADNLYPTDVYEWTTVFSGVDFRAPDLERYPRVRRAAPLEAQLTPGDVLFIPVRWWHAAWCLSPCVSLNGWWFTPRLLASGALWREFARAAAHRIGLVAKDRCTCHGHGDLGRHLGWSDATAPTAVR